MSSSDGRVDMSEFLKDATNSNMYMVDHNDTSQLVNDFKLAIETANKLCENVDPETTPYKSKYEAREILDKISQKLEATKTIASLEKKKELVFELNCRLASVHIQLGIIAWECDEPHNAQNDLEEASHILIPGYVQAIHVMTKDNVDQVDIGNSPYTQNPKGISDDELEPPILTSDVRMLVETMKLLNMLGILWAGRGQVKRSFLFLLAAKKVYDEHKLDNFAVVKMNSICLTKKLSNVITDFESHYTHNLFYLAQAYGNIGNSTMSSKYCKETLQRQLNAGLVGIKAALDWVRNSASIADYYMAIGDYVSCSLILSSTEKVLTEKVINVMREEQSLSNSESKGEKKMNRKDGDIDGHDIDEVRGDLNRRFARMDLNLLKRAVEDELMRVNDYMAGISKVKESVIEELDENEELYGKLKLEKVDSKLITTLDELRCSIFKVDSSNRLDQLDGITITTKGGESNHEIISIMRKREFFVGLPVPEMPLTKEGSIDCFEKARLIFLRASGRIEEAKKIFPMDGCVSDHTSLLQDQAKFYHYLSIFETDLKRKTAMETRRIEILQPLIFSLSRSAFEVLHKQLSFELGEGYLALMDIKLEKYTNPESRDVNTRHLKFADLVKCNNFCKNSLAMFFHFASFYKGDKGGDVVDYSKFQLEDFVEAPFTQIDISLITIEEIRPFLNSHFLCARVFSKILSPPIIDVSRKTDNVSDKLLVPYFIAALRRYEWLSKFAVELCNRKEVEISAVFKEEHEICVEMVKYLPNKIDKMMY